MCWSRHSSESDGFPVERGSVTHFTSSSGKSRCWWPRFVATTFLRIGPADRSRHPPEHRTAPPAARSELTTVVATSPRQNKSTICFSKRFSLGPEYTLDPRLRMHADIDLFVPAVLVQRANRAVMALGFEPLRATTVRWQTHSSRP